MQGVGSPVSAAVRGAQAGPGSSSYRDCSVGELVHLTSTASNVPSVDTVAEVAHSASVATASTSNKTESHSRLERRNDQLERFGDRIRQLIEFMKDSHNVHKIIKTRCEVLTPI